MAYVVACSKLWIPDIHLKLEKALGEPFILVQKKEDLSLEKLKAIQPRAIFFPHWSYILPAEIYQNFQCVMFHMTDLPFGRGGSPLQNLIARGHAQTKISAFLCDGGLDTGPIFMKQDLELSGTAQEIFLRAQTLILDMIVRIVHEKPSPQKQEGPVVEFKRRKPEDGNLNQAQDLKQVFDFIRMLDADGYPPAFLETDNFRLEFSKAQHQEGQVIAQVRILKNEK